MRREKYTRLADRIDERYRATTGNKGKPHDAVSCPEAALFIEVCALACEIGTAETERELKALNADRRKAGSRELWLSPSGMPKPE
jgi:hypothetical protein